MENSRPTLFEQIFDKCIVGITFITSILMVMLTTIVFLEVLSRYLFKFPFAFTGELTQVLFPWIVFLGAIAITKNEGHLAITFFTNKFSKKIKKVILILSKLIMLYFSFFMFKSSFDLSKSVIAQLLPVLRISKAWLYSSVTVAFIVITIVLIYQIYLLINNRVDLEEEDSYDLGNDS